MPELSQNTQLGHTHYSAGNNLFKAKNQININIAENKQKLEKEKSFLLKQIEAGERVGWGSTPGEKLPSQRNKFIGRKKLLNELHAQFGTINSDGEKFTPQSNIPLIISAYKGLGGVGKTQLALRYLIETEKQYNLRVWFHAEDVNALQGYYIQFAKTLGYESEESSFNEAVSYINNTLSENFSWIIVYDNVTDYQSIEKFLPTAKGGRILITTRCQDWPNDVYVLPTELMDEKDAVLLVEILTKRNDEEIKELVALLGYLPLALAQASAYIAHYRGSVSVPEYIRRYKRNEKDMLDYKRLPIGAEHKPVAITWRISIEAIQDEAKRQDISLLAPILLLPLAYLGPEQIPLSIITSWFEKTYSEESSDILGELLGQLHKFSLITFSEDVISIHRLIQTVVRIHHRDNALMKLNIDAPKITLEWYNTLLKVTHDNIQNIMPNRERNARYTETKDKVKNILSHLEYLIKYYDELWPKEELNLALGCVVADIGSIFIDPVCNPALSIRYNERALRIFEGLQESYNTMATLMNLAKAYGDLGKIEYKETLLLRALKIYDGLYNSNYDNHQLIILSAILTNLGKTYGELGKISKKKEILEESLEIQKNLYPNDHPQLAITLTHLGNANGELGNVKKQIELLRSIPGYV